jgi:hypothetical protein
MRLHPVGRVSDPTVLDVEPIEVPIVGYDKNKNEVETLISFVGDQPAGAALDIVRAVDEDGNINGRACLMFVDNCVHPDSRIAWEDLMHRPDIKVANQTIVDLYVALAEAYANRPTSPRSGSRAGRGSTKKTSQAGASGRASGAKTFR